MKTYGGMEVYLHTFVISALDGGVGGQLRAPVALSPGKKPPITIKQEAEWAPAPVWTRWRRENGNLFPSAAGNRTQVVQPIA
jgi:hypothetical protein